MRGYQTTEFEADSPAVLLRVPDVSHQTVSSRPRPSPLILLFPPKRARPRTSKACRKRKSRCERLPGDDDDCHRCEVIGIPCLLARASCDGCGQETQATPAVTASSSTEAGCKWGARPTSVCTRKQLGRQDSWYFALQFSPDKSQLHILANTTEMLSRASSSSQPPPPVSSSTPKTPLSPQTLSTVEYTLLPPPVDPETSRFRLDWQRCVAPLTLLQTLVRRNTVSDRHWRQDAWPIEADLLSPFLIHYAPWLPAVSLFATATTMPPTISPFLSTVICATASCTWPTPLPSSTISSLRALSLHHIGQIFANPVSYPAIESLYALLARIMWPLDLPDDVTLLIHANGMYSFAPSNVPPTTNLSPENLDLIRSWYAICTNETIFTLDADTIANPPPTTILSTSLGTPSSIALS
ncbi:hypothetical protein M422DRAFT_245939 [Sphaerobolus stellatus SS14]|nr:hypothetical protein M422DRAFT_245939 [Sphaerobolus stellatus SS14]